MQIFQEKINEIDLAIEKLRWNYEFQIKIF
jgi:hypothetical protein